MLGIIFGIFGFSITQNQILFLGFAGALGTFFTLIDPFGILIRHRAKERIDERKNDEEKELGPTLRDYKISSLKSRAISIEIDKIVGLFYFITIMILFMLATVTSTSFIEKLTIKDLDGKIICENLCLKTISWIGVGIVLTFLALRANQFWYELDDKIDVASFHQKAIGNDYATENSVENMTRAIDQNDWETAKLWWNKIEDEIKYKKGKKEVVIKVADLVYTPLHKTTIDFQKQIKFLKYNRRFPTYNVGEWDTIKSNSNQSLIEESNLRTRIESFYDLVSKYNDFMGTVNRKADQILNQRASEIYEKDVKGIDYDVESPQGSGKVELFGCALFDVHPLDYYNVRGRLRSLRVEFVNENLGTGYANFNDTQLFDKMWELVRMDVKKDPDIIKMHNYFDKIKQENEELSKIFREKIAMQLKV